MGIWLHVLLSQVVSLCSSELNSSKFSHPSKTCVPNVPVYEELFPHSCRGQIGARVISNKTFDKARDDGADPSIARCAHVLQVLG